MLIAWNAFRFLFYLVAEMLVVFRLPACYAPLAIVAEFCALCVFLACKRLRAAPQSYWAKVPAASYWVGLATLLLLALCIVR